MLYFLPSKYSAISLQRYAADGCARKNGVAAMVVTYTVGGLSAINAIAGAYSDDLPIIFISGAPNSNDYASDRILHHTIGKIDRRQQIDMFSHVVAEAVEIRSPGQAARQIDHAIVTAMTQKKPVYLDVACNISEEHVSLPIPFQIPPPKPSNAASLRAAVQTTLTQWTHAAKPVIVIGVKVRMAEAFDAVIQLADAAGCAVATMPDAKGMFPEDHPQYIGTYWGPVSSVGAGETVESADMYIFLGSRFNDYNTTGYTCLIKKKGLVTANVDRVETPGGEYGCVNMAEFAVALAKVIPRNDASIKAYTRIFAPEARVAARPAETLLTMRFVHEQVQNLLTPKTALLVETGDSWFQGQTMKLPRGCGYEFQMQYGSIGWSVGAVLGYSLAAQHEGRRVVAMIGDGSFQMSAQEVSTMIRYGANPIIVLINNGGYTIEVEIHDGIYNVIKNWDYKKLIDAFCHDDGKALTICCKTQGELLEAMEQAKTHPNLVFLELILDKDDCSKHLLEWGSRVATANGRPFVEL
ncbi:pyruvate decarboxylase [Nannochloropsis gaditana]|uniref:pyruvate decarboxylase n=1 Tax=Nannochloropsis gaditana TaxID=72520 RepID=W7U6Y7_9STRA|nr:pyruvate decarboxylase [Nannochloropsis gaditana]